MSLDIVPDRGKDLDEPFPAGLLEVHRVHLGFSVRGFKIGICGKGTVTAEFLRPFDRNFRKPREDVVLEDLEDRVLGDLRGTERLLALLPDLVLSVGYRDIVSLRGGHLLAVKAIEDGGVDTDRGL